MTFIIFDIETTGLDPSENGFVTCICTLNVDTQEKKSFVINSTHNEKELIHNFWQYIASINRCFLIGFNSNGFDLPYLIHRSIVRNEKIPMFVNLDLRKIVNSYFISYESKVKGNLAYWATVLGIQQSTENGAQMVTYFLQGKYKEIEEHCKEDVEVEYELFKRCRDVGLITENGERFFKGYDKWK
jgi:uncharacterized protein YprB with RNaseH-like and TPR domain